MTSTEPPATIESIDDGSMLMSQSSKPWISRVTPVSTFPRFCTVIVNRPSEPASMLLKLLESGANSIHIEGTTSTAISKVWTTMSAPGVVASRIIETRSSRRPIGRLPGSSRPMVTNASRFMSSSTGMIDWNPPTQPSGRLPTVQSSISGTFPAFRTQTSFVPV